MDVDSVQAGRRFFFPSPPPAFPLRKYAPSLSACDTQACKGVEPCPKGRRGMRLLLFLDSCYKLAGMTDEKQVVDMILPDFVPEGPSLSYPNLPPVIPEGFYRVSRKNNGFKRRGFPMTTVGNDRRKTVADVILPDFVPEGPPVIPEPPPCHTRRFLSGIQKKQWSQKSWIPATNLRE